MNDFKKKLFIQYALVVFLIVAFFESILIIGMKKSFDMHLKDRLTIIANEINPNNFNNNELLNLQHKYKIFPLFVKITKLNNLNHIKTGFSTRKIHIFNTEKVLIYTTVKKPYLIQISTLYSTNDDKLKIIKINSLIASIVIYLISLIIGWKFIDTISKEIEFTFKRLKNFNSNVSHELKTPLAIIKSDIEVALMNKERNCDKLLKDILDEIEYINSITEKLLFLTKNFNNKTFQKVDLEELIFELYDKYEQKIEFELNFGDDDYIILGDKILLKIAIGNLIENSIKYGANKIIITLQKQKHKIILSVKDNGIGIPKEKLPFIFDEFYRVDESHNKNIKGFGLGLSIVKTILKLHKAKVNVKSEGGVEFIIEFPAFKEK